TYFQCTKDQGRPCLQAKALGLRSLEPSQLTPDAQQTDAVVLARGRLAEEVSDQQKTFGQPECCRAGATRPIGYAAAVPRISTSGVDQGYDSHLRHGKHAWCETYRAGRDGRSGPAAFAKTPQGAQHRQLPASLSMPRGVPELEAG